MGGFHITSQLFNAIQWGSKTHQNRVLEYYTTNSVWPWETGGPVNSHSVNLACLYLSSLQKSREANSGPGPKHAAGRCNRADFQGFMETEHINNTDGGWTSCNEESLFTRLRLSSQDWLICMAAWTSLCLQKQKTRNKFIPVSILPTTNVVTIAAF